MGPGLGAGGRWPRAGGRGPGPGAGGGGRSGGPIWGLGAGAHHIYICIYTYLRGPVLSWEPGAPRAGGPWGRGVGPGAGGEPRAGGVRGPGSGAGGRGPELIIYISLPPDSPPPIVIYIYIYICWGGSRELGESGPAPPSL